jgi:hypothetical protein
VKALIHFKQLVATRLSIVVSPTFQSLQGLPDYLVREAHGQSVKFVAAGSSVTNLTQCFLIGNVDD